MAKRVPATIVARVGVKGLGWWLCSHSFWAYPFNARGGNLRPARQMWPA